MCTRPPQRGQLVVSDYFLNEDDFGKVHFERFDLDFNTAFATGPARPHGVAMK